jgi:predicted DNA-binding transcriptional regulator AlpA
MATHELLTPEEFANKLKIGRSTLFEWIGKGILLPGQHYFKIGRVVRFVWSDDLIQLLLQRTVTISIDGDILSQSQVQTYKKPIKSANNKKSGINWEY